MKKFWKDFKNFISKGNIIDLAVAVVIGAAFGKIVTSLVNDIIMPLISFSTGGVSISDWKWIITPADAEAGIAESALYYGNFIQTIIDFLIISFFIFLAIRILQASRNKLEEISKEISTEIKKKNKKGKKGEILETETVVKEDPSATIEKTKQVKEPKLSENEQLIESMNTLVKQSQKTNKSQKQLLKEIRILLKK